MSADFSIIQRSFDSAVEENMDVFGMSREEAVSSAIDEFKSRGVNVQMLVDDGSFTELADRVSALTPLLIADSNSASDTDTNSAPDVNAAPDADIQNQLTWLKLYCERSLAHRCAAGRLDLYTILLKWLSQQNLTADNDTMSVCDKTDTLTVAVVQTLSALQCGQPDLFDADGARSSLALLQLHRQRSFPLTSAALSWLAAVTFKHEQNRRQLSAAGLLQLLSQLLEQLLSCSAGDGEQLQLVKLVCAVGVNFTRDDDVRVEFGDAHKNAKCLVDAGVLLALRTAIVSGVDTDLDGDVLESLLHLSAKLCVCKDNCDVVAADGGLSAVLQLMEEHKSHMGVCRRGLSLLAALTGSDTVKEDIIDAGGAPLIVSILNKRKGNVIISSTGARLISCLTLRSSTGSISLCEAGVVSLLADMMDSHQNNASLQKLVCMSVRNILSRCSQLQPLFVEAAIEQRIRSAMVSCKELEFEAKQALRCLGLEVQLKELWTGHGGALTTGLIQEPERLITS